MKEMNKDFEERQSKSARIGKECDNQVNKLQFGFALVGFYAMGYEFCFYSEFDDKNRKSIAMRRIANQSQTQTDIDFMYFSFAERFEYIVWK